ncbi:alginate export family protein [Mariniflexile gromovii]|uniref:Alginate export family protein n=1 Tax=Mariniflexile gromovii TaxID=362523 RepID=A0ABS4BUP2_9FLAO|nr:porin [Mariniflexile gromovii]MBP0904309.1 alginate export family protein [Mariniflexile gromovii]
MKIWWIIHISLVFIIGCWVCYPQDNNKLQFHLLGQEDDMSFLDKKENKSGYEKLKWIDLKNQNYLSFGGDYRFQVENFVNEDFTNKSDQDNIWYLNRFLVHLNLKLGKNFMVYSELNSSTVINKTDISPVDKDILSFNQFFIKYNFNSKYQLTLGRENLMFGGRRLVDIREGPNVRRSFDLARIDYNNINTTISAFFSIPVKVRFEIFDNKYLQFEETFSGIYATKNFNEATNFDFYFLYQKDDNVTYNIGSDNERRYSAGMRFFGRVNNFSFNNEAVYQFGSFGNLDIQAYTLSVLAEYSTKFISWQTNLGLKTEVISGDKTSNDAKLNTFDALYPRGAYFGRVAKFGPSNLIDVHPYISLMKSTFYIELDYDAFWRYSITDGLYNAALILEYPSTNTEAFIGHQLGALLGYNLNNHLNIELETNLIIPGKFLKKSDLVASLFHTVITTQLKF